MKKRNIFLLFPLCFLCCGFVRSGTYGTVGITICSYTETTISDDPASLFEGHSYIEIENNRSWSLDLGFYQLPPFYKCTIGVWDASTSGGSSSDTRGSFDDGIFFNREAYIFSHTDEQPTNCLKYYKEVDVGTFITRMYDNDENEHFLKIYADYYSYADFNCSQFVGEFYKIATQEDVLPRYVTPLLLRNSIRLLINHRQDNSCFSASSYFRYSQNGDGYVYP